MKNQTLFDLLTLPEGIDKDTVVDNILLEGGEFEVLYADPDFMRQAVKTWGDKHYYTFDKWARLQAIQYNPLENYDRIEDWTDTSSARRDSGNTRTFDNQDKRTLDTQDEDTLDTTVTSEDQVSAFDSSNYQPSEKNTTDNDGTNTTTHTGTDTVDYSGTIKDEYGEGSSGNTVHAGHIHGNIGTVTAQKMYTEEVEVARFNIVEQITDLFLQEFCIMVYD